MLPSTATKGARREIPNDQKTIRTKRVPHGGWYDSQGHYHAYGHWYYDVTGYCWNIQMFRPRRGAILNRSGKTATEAT
jgi:hypothetical protein